MENGQDEATKTSRKENESNGINNNVDVDIAQEKEEEGELEKQNEAEENEVVETVEEKPKDVPNGCSNDKDLDGSKATTQGGKVPQVILIFLNCLLQLDQRIFEALDFIIILNTITFFCVF